LLIYLIKVVVHQRAKSQDFQPLLIEERMKIIEGIFKNSFYKVDTGLSMAKLNIPGYQVVSQLNAKNTNNLEYQR